LKFAFLISKNCQFTLGFYAKFLIPEYFCRVFVFAFFILKVLPALNLQNFTSLISKIPYFLNLKFNKCKIPTLNKKHKITKNLQNLIYAKITIKKTKLSSIK
jgi:hypothetical protein